MAAYYNEIDPEDWTGEPEAKAEYDRTLRVVAALSKLRAPVAGEAQPVAWRYWNEKSQSWNTTTSAVVADAMREAGRVFEPLYATPQGTETTDKKETS